MMTTSNDNADNTFILEQLEEALEERQNPDRRQQDPEGYVGVDRRKGDRRQDASAETKH